MVRGVTRQIVMVDPADKTLFEKAIFILRDSSRPDSPEALLREASRIAAECTENPGRKKRRWLYPLLWTGSGAALTGIVWLCSLKFR